MSGKVLSRKEMLFVGSSGIANGSPQLLRGLRQDDLKVQRFSETLSEGGCSSVIECLLTV